MSDCRRFPGLAELHWPKYLISGAAKDNRLYNASVLSDMVTGQTIHEAYSRDFFLGIKRNQPFGVVR